MQEVLVILVNEVIVRKYLCVLLLALGHILLRFIRLSQIDADTGQKRCLVTFLTLSRAKQTAYIYM